MDLDGRLVMRLYVARDATKRHLLPRYVWEHICSLLVNALVFPAISLPVLNPLPLISYMPYVCGVSRGYQHIIGFELASHAVTGPSHVFSMLYCDFASALANDT